MLALLAFILASTVVPYLLFRGYAERVAADDGPLEDRLHRIDRAQRIGFFLLPIFAVLSAIGLNVIDQAEAAAGTVAPAVPFGGLLEEAAVFGTIFVIVTLPIAAGIAGTHPTVRRLRDTSASYGRVLKGTLLGTGFVMAVVVAWIGLTELLPSWVTDSTLLLVVVLGSFVAVLYALSPYSILLLSDRVPLEGDRRGRVEDLCSDLGYRPRGVYLLEGESTKAANAMVAGTLPGRRYVFLTDYLLAEATDDELRAILAHEFGHVAGRHLWQQGVATVATFGSYAVLADVLPLDALDAYGFAGTAATMLLIVGAFAFYYYVVLGALALYHEYRADAYAAAETGVEATADALALLADTNDARRDAGRLYALATHHPSIEDRIDAVRSD